MKIAVTDANIFIDLFELGLVAEFFELDLEVHTTYDVVFELNVTQRQTVRLYEHRDSKLTLHAFPAEEMDAIRKQGFPPGLSFPDMGVIYLAIRLGALILSSDGLVRKTAAKRKVATHGVLWIFDKLVDQQILSPSVAVQKLNGLLALNPYYANNPILKRETEKRISDWQG